MITPTRSFLTSASPHREPVVRSHTFAALGSLVLVAAGMATGGCTKEAPPQVPMLPKVSVLKVQPGPVTVHNEYVAQTQAPDTIEIRSQVTGLLARQRFVDGAQVKKGSLLYEIDPRPFQAQRAQVQASVAQAEANLANAQQNLARSSRLIADKAISRHDFEAAVSQERSSAAVVDAQRALLQTADLNLEFATLRAPRDGFMSSSALKPGSLVTAQQTLLCTLYSSDPMWVNFSISEDRLLQLQRAPKRPDTMTPFRIKLADGSDYGLAGRLDFVDSAIDQMSGTLKVRISVPNPDRLLRPGLFVRVTVPVLDSPLAIRIPQQAVQEVQGIKSVFVVDDNNKVLSRAIVAQHRLGNEWVVDSGLTPGDRVVVEGTGKLRSGAAVTPVDASAVVVPGAPMKS